MDRAAREIVRQLKEIGELHWRDPKGKRVSLSLDEGGRRLVTQLAEAAEKREATGEVAATRGHLDDELFLALEDCWSNDTPAKDEEAAPVASEGTPRTSDIWLLSRVEAKGFGGLSGASSKKTFAVDFSSNSSCIYGGNGSGKTSLISAICWALTGQRLSDATGLSEDANTPQPIFSASDPNTKIGMWPPVATYPATTNEMKPITRVTLTFAKKDSDEEASISRAWDADAANHTIEEWDDKLALLRDHLDVAIEMPLRIGHLRLGENGRLNDAVASLTGLDAITALGQLTSWLTRKNAPFLNNPKPAEHTASARAILTSLEKAVQLVPSIKESLEQYKLIGDWIGRASDLHAGLSAIADKLTTTAGNDLQSLKSFVADSINLGSADDQKSIANAVAAALNTYTTNYLKDTFVEKCPLLTKLGSIANRADETTELINAAVVVASNQFDELIRVHRLRLNDKKVSLKALAAETHRAEHGDTPINECVLCDRTLDTAELSALGVEIQRLASDAKLLIQPLQAACSDLVTTLATSIEQATSLSLTQASSLHPAQALRQELQSFLIRSHSFSAQLPIFGRLFDSHFGQDDSAGAITPTASEPIVSISDLPSQDQAILQRAILAITQAGQAIEIVDWAKANIGSVRTSYKNLLGEASSETFDSNTIRGMCKILSRAINEAKPAQDAAAEIAATAKLSATWLNNEAKRRLRTQIASSIEPLEKLPKFVEAEVGRQIGELSSEISSTVQRFHLSAPLEFRRARYERPPRQRTGVLRARATPKKFKLASAAPVDDDSATYEVDAARIANTSWTRALLWAFIFSLRKERTKLSRTLPLPMMLMDDPQTTFDLEHRCAWIDYMLSDQADDRIAPLVQAILTSHDQAFIQQVHLQAPGCEVRHIAAPPNEFEPAFVDGTNALDILWGRAENSKQNKDASQAIGALRTYLEGMTRTIFPRALGASATTLGQLMDELQGKVNAGEFPYQSVEFTNLLRAWKEQTKQPLRDALSDVHHENEPRYDYTFGKNLFAWFNKALKGPFQRAFDRIRLIREAGWRTPHSGVSIVSRVGVETTIGKALPLPANLNRLIGKVAAESEGREVEGQPSLRFVPNDEELPSLENHEALVLAAATLEPTAQIGDVLLLSSVLPPTENSLVVCHVNGAWRARRYGSLGSSSEHAVLVANSVNPREIRQPILADKRPSNFRKIVGIIYRRSWSAPPAGDDEATDLLDLSALNKLLSHSIGRIQVIGDSAEPIALQGQFLISAPQVPAFKELVEYDGRPIVADLNGRVVFKRLRLTKRGESIVLESLDSAGRHPPIIVSPEEARALGDKLRFWPVLGVLFDTARREPKA